METGIRQGFSTETDVRLAMRQIQAAIDQPNLSMVLFFCSPEYNLDLLAVELNRAFSGIPVAGCTTAGEIGPNGYHERGIVAVSFSHSVCSAVCGYSSHLQHYEPADGHTLASRLLFELENKTPDASAQNTFAFLIADGLSVREEVVARSIKEALGSIPLIGGSAGDGLNFRRTWVFANGSFRSDCAVLALISTPLPFLVFKAEHFVPTGERWVITQADPSLRIVYEINGSPAAQEFARLAGVPVKALTPRHFATTPLAVYINGSFYIRSIQKVNPDDSVTFYCAIEEGVVLRVVRGLHLIESLEDAFARIRSAIGPPLLVLACDCILRRMEIVERHIEPLVEQIFLHNSAIGFNTYGEIYDGIHINQTLTGIAIGAANPEVQVG
ncbi:MAG: FIST N-terminal domain-containing protein [Terracidiphilus sp.]|nr:FIST N-terminal domain-containing protein [Terracidiphilus sp.]